MFHSITGRTAFETTNDYRPILAAKGLPLDESISFLPNWPNLPFGSNQAQSLATGSSTNEFFWKNSFPLSQSLDKRTD